MKKMTEIEMSVVTWVIKQYILFGQHIAANKWLHAELRLLALHYKLSHTQQHDFACDLLYSTHKYVPPGESELFCLIDRQETQEIL